MSKRYIIYCYCQEKVQRYVYIASTQLD